MVKAALVVLDTQIREGCAAQLLEPVEVTRLDERAAAVIAWARYAPQEWWGHEVTRDDEGVFVDGERVAGLRNAHARLLELAALRRASDLE